MNDFLKNMRTPRRTPQRSPHTRQSSPPRILEDDQQQNLVLSERRKLMDRRSSLPQGVGTGLLLESLNDAVPFLKENIAQIAICMERLVDNQERIANAELEKNQVVTALLQNLNQILTENLLPILRAEPVQPSGSFDPDHHHDTAKASKEEVIHTIRTMRNNRATFAEIADHLKLQGIPTFSGRGEWHAQTIHRLCK